MNGAELLVPPYCPQKTFLQRHDASRDGRLIRRKPIPGVTFCKREPVSNDFEVDGSFGNPPQITLQSGNSSRMDYRQA